MFLTGLQTIQLNNYFKITYFFFNLILHALLEKQQIIEDEHDIKSMNIRGWFLQIIVYNNCYKLRTRTVIHAWKRQWSE